MYLFFFFISLIHFISKSKKWADMISMPPELRRKIDKLEKNFAVSMVIFKKFQPIFAAMFNYIKDEQTKSRSKKQKLVNLLFILVIHIIIALYYFYYSNNFFSE